MARPRKKSTDNPTTSSSSSSDDDKTSQIEPSPFSFSSLQTLTPSNKETNSVELDQLYPSNIELTNQTNGDDDDDEFLLAAAAKACPTVKSD